MLFNSYQFLFGFLPVVLLGFYIIRSASQRGAVLWLGTVSIFFYGWWNWHFLPLLLGSVVFNFVAGLVLFRMELDAIYFRRVIFFFAVATNLAALAYFKYMNFFVDNMNLLLSHPFQIVRVILPIGISFYTFTQIAFLVDTYEGFANEPCFSNYLLFVTYFPHLIAGPIIHHSEMMPQFDRASRDPVAENLAVGVSVFVIGLAKKTILADGIAGFATMVFNGAHSGVPPTLLEAWCGISAYTLQLYFDFSGYSDMAVGISRMFGIRLPVNFNSPLKARSIIEYWQRWHMTLTRWITAYLYNPVAKQMMSWRLRKGFGIARRDMQTVAGFVTMVAIPMSYTMLLAGVWHGAGFQFAIFGLLHAFYLSMNHAWRLFSSRLPPIQARIARALTSLRDRALTYLAVFIALAFFRADSVTDALSILGGMAGLHGVILPEGYSAWLGPVAGIFKRLGINFAPVTPLYSGGTEVAYLALLFAIVWFFPNTQQIVQRYRPVLDSGIRSNIPAALIWRPTAAWGVAISLLFVCSILSLNRITTFLYFQF